MIPRGCSALIQSSLDLCEFNGAFTRFRAVREGCHAAVLMDK
jgi:hypothetical protein